MNSCVNSIIYCKNNNMKPIVIYKLIDDINNYSTL